MQVCDSEDTGDDEVTVSNVRCPERSRFPHLFVLTRLLLQEGPGAISAATKGATPSYRTERGSRILDARAEWSPWMGVYHYLPLFSSLSFSVCHSRWQSLIASDKLMKSNTEKQLQPFIQPAPAAVCVCVCAYLSVLGYWLSCCLGRASLSKTMMIQYESNEKLVHTFRSRSVRWLWI